MLVQLLFHPPESPSALALPYVQTPALHAGFPSPAADYVETALDLHEYLIANPVATFYAQVRGDSMIDERIHDGDILVVDRSVTARHNRVVIATSSADPDQLYVKLFTKIRGRPVLMSRNEQRATEYPPIYLDEHAFEIWGVVTAVIRKF